MPRVGSVQRIERTAQGRRGARRTTGQLPRRLVSVNFSDPMVVFALAFVGIILLGVILTARH